MITRRLLFSIGFLAAVSVFGLHARSAQAVEPAEFIEDMGRQAVNSLTGRNISQHQREERFRKILRSAFDMTTIARFTLGQYWRIASDQEREEYVALFEDFIVQAYANRFKDYQGETFQVGKVHEINSRDKLVLSEIIRPEGPPVKVNWRVRGNSNYRIVDVVVEGISMGITQRDEFASVIRNSGGKVEGLLVALRKKTGRK